MIRINCFTNGFGSLTCTVRVEQKVIDEATAGKMARLAMKQYLAQRDTDSAYRLKILMVGTESMVTALSNVEIDTYTYTEMGN